MAQITDFFVGANSGDGFRNLFPEMVDIEDTYDLMVLKGGPGVGKNTFMREVVRAMEAAGTAVERLWCSGDPDSLDGVVLPELRCAVVDGTSPHGSETKGHLRRTAAANPASPSAGYEKCPRHKQGSRPGRLLSQATRHSPSHTARRFRGSDTKQGRSSGPSPSLLMKKTGGRKLKDFQPPSSAFCLHRPVVSHLSPWSVGN